MMAVSDADLPASQAINFSTSLLIEAKTAEMMAASST